MLAIQSVRLIYGIRDELHGAVVGPAEREEKWTVRVCLVLFLLQTRIVGRGRWGWSRWELLRRLWLLPLR